MQHDCMIVWIWNNNKSQRQVFRTSMKMLQWLLSTLVECLLLLLLLLLCGLCLSLCNSGRVVSHELLISTCCLGCHVALGQEASSYTLCTLLGDQDSEFGMSNKVTLLLLQDWVLGEKIVG